MTTLYTTIIASTYGSGTYDSSNYNGTNATGTTGGTGTTGTTGGTLSNTGVMVGLIVGAAALILLAAMIVRIWKRPSRTKVADQTSTEE